MKPLTTRLFVSACLALATSSIADEAIRPNGLFLISDDLNHSLGCYGQPHGDTPRRGKG
jgi:hypothetical protein